MHLRSVVALLAWLALARPAAALYVIDTFAGRGYGDGGPAIAAAVISPADAVTDAVGNVYFSDKGDQLVRRVEAATGTITTVAGNGSPGSEGDGGLAVLANLHDPVGVALDPGEQQLYVVENLGARVRRVDLTTGIISTFAGTGDVSTGADDIGDDGPATAAHFNQPVGVAVNADGDVFVSERDEDHPDPTAFDTHHPRIRRIDHATGTISLYAGNLPEGFNGDGLAAVDTQLSDPITILFDGAGNLWIGELGNHRVRVIAAAAPHVVSTVAGTGSFDEGPQQFSGDGGPATSAGLDQPAGIAIEPRGCGGSGAPACVVYIGDSRHHCVRKVGTDGIITTVVNAPPAPDTTPLPGDTGDGGQALDARLLTPAARPGPNGTILVVDDDPGANRVRLYDPGAGTIRAFAGTGEGGFGGDGGPAVRALLNRPTGLAVDAVGNVFVTEHDNFIIRQIAADANHTASTFAGTPGEEGGGGNGGPALAAQFGQPTGITFTGVGDLLVTDALTETVRRIDHASSVIRAFAGTGDVGAGGDGGPATAAQLNTPLRTAIGPSGDVFIADFNNNAIRHIDASGVITTFASGLANPAGLVLGRDGLLYESDFGSERILTVDPSGTVAPFAGTGTATGSIDGEGGNPADDLGDGGPAGAATFSDPTGVSFDVDGSLLVADQGNSRIRRIALDGTGKLSAASIVTTVAGDGRPTYGGDGGDALRASFNRPTEALALGDRRILVADRGNQRVRVLTPSQGGLCDVPCDDHDPCTVDTCDPVKGCMHQPGPDRDGDGVPDACDNCPDVPNPTQDPNACPGGGGGGGGTACTDAAPACIPGAGPRATECLVETVVTGAQGTPVVRCTDGDPSCDANPAPGECGFTVSWCFNNADPRLQCSARGLSRLSIRVAMRPRSAARGFVSTAVDAVRQATAGGASRPAAVVFASPFTAPNTCTKPMTADVAVRGRAGHERPGKALLSVTGRTSGHGRDADKVRLVCLPAS
jgi:sugar lactone lactonase YvrE